MNPMKTLLTAAAFAAALALPASADTVDIGGGVTLAYDKARSGAQNVILIHGYSFSKDIWSKVMPEIAGDATVYAYDMRGFGDSTKTDSGYDFATMAADLGGFMISLGIDSAVLVGHSLGRVFLQDFATAHPEKAAHLVLMNVQARNKPPLGMSDGFRARIDAWGAPEDNKAIFERATPIYFKRGSLSDAQLAELVEMNVNSGTAALKESFEFFLTAEPMADAEFAKITAPTTIVAATHDIVPISVAAGLLDSLPQIEVVVVSRSGHSPMWEKPEAIVGVIQEALGN